MFENERFSAILEQNWTPTNFSFKKMEWWNGERRFYTFQRRQTTSQIAQKTASLSLWLSNPFFFFFFELKVVWRPYSFLEQTKCCLNAWSMRLAMDTFCSQLNTKQGTKRNWQSTSWRSNLDPISSTSHPNSENMQWREIFFKTNTI